VEDRAHSLLQVETLLLSDCDTKLLTLLYWGESISRCPFFVMLDVLSKLNFNVFSLINCS